MPFECGFLLITRECNSDIVIFTDIVVVEFQLCDSNNTTPDPDTISELQDLFSATYNNLAMQYCDPYFRSLQSVVESRRGQLTPDGNLPIEFE